jgi:ankyrin repeat protein
MLERTNLLISAADSGDREALIRLLRAGDDLDQDLIKVHGLIMASSQGWVEEVKMALTTDVDVNQTLSVGSTAGITALGMASIRGHIEVIRELFKSNASVDQMTGGEAGVKGLTALMMASSSGCTQAVKVLLHECKANPNLKSEAGSTALCFASSDGHTEVVDLLLKANADPNTQCSDGLTALMNASHGGHVKAARLLLNKGADLTLLANNGSNALDIARTSHGEGSDIYKLLIKQPAKVTATIILGIRQFRMFNVGNVYVSKDVAELVARAVLKYHRF